MRAKVRLMTRRRRLPGSDRHTSETLILSERGVVAVLAEGDPLRGLLRLSVGELRATRENLPPALQERPGAVEMLDAIIECKATVESEGPATG